MSPNYISPSAPSPFSLDPNSYLDKHNHRFVPDFQASSSLSSQSCHEFFGSTRDHTGCLHETRQSHKQHEDENHASPARSYVAEKKASKGLKFSLSTNEDETKENPVKWMSSKIRLMQKMKNSNRNEDSTISTCVKIEDNKRHVSSSPEVTDNFSSKSSSNSCNPQARVCADCNTSKTPLWRSGPKGPKSLCNACGIRQRKARRAMAEAAAAAAANGTRETAFQLKIKAQNKEKAKTSCHAAQFKKRSKPAAESSQPQKKNGFEEFLLNWSAKLALHHAFPQDEKDAAILLMALSCGLLHD